LVTGMQSSTNSNSDSVYLELNRKGLDLGDKGCASLASALHSNPCHLRKLELSNNSIQDSGLKQLSTALESHHFFGMHGQHLYVFFLPGCLVTKEGCACLASAISTNHSHLRNLDLSNNNLQDLGVKLLSALSSFAHLWDQPHNWRTPDLDVDQFQLPERNQQRRSSSNTSAFSLIVKMAVKKSTKSLLRHNGIQGPTEL
uniref:SPRY-associated domain-containing protein n=1 Tax=Amphilophus citrinellus TaxID=61819 RepID=A0A3Q0QTK5_AMPCI